MFDTERIEVDRGSVYTVPDLEDSLHREPLVARFRVRGPPGTPAESAFTFSLVNIHTDPDETATELPALADVFQAVQRDGSGEDDVILLGDLNADERHLGRLASLPGSTQAICRNEDQHAAGHMGTTTSFLRPGHGRVHRAVGSAAQFDRRIWPVAQGVLDILYDLPVWAEFSTMDARTAIAGRSTATR